MSVKQINRRCREETSTRLGATKKKKKKREKKQKTNGCVCCISVLYTVRLKLVVGTESIRPDKCNADGLAIIQAWMLPFQKSVD